MQHGGAACEADAGKRALAQSDARGGGGGIVIRADAEQVAEKLSDVGIVADDEDVLVGAAVAQQALELGEGGGRRKGVGDKQLLLVAGFGGDELGGLLGALEGARDNKVKVGLECIEDVGKLQALGLAVLVEGTLDVEERIGAANTGAGVAENI